jgi:hypothetical protein
MQTIKPNLFIPGAAKSGTTSLHELLDFHPDICMSNVKEPVFWNFDDYNHPKRITWYNSLFSNPNSEIIGESTTSYMYFPEFIFRIKQHFTETPKFIFILRNPIDRCYSNYWYLVGRGQEKKDFITSIKEDLNREFTNYGYLPNYYYHFGRYGYWLQKFYDNFESNYIKIITLEQLKANPLETVNSCFNFLGISELDSIPEITSNKTKKLKHPRLYHFVKKTLIGKYSFTKVAKYLLSKRKREAIKTKLRSNKIITQSESLNYPKLNEKDRQWLQTLYKDDVKLLKNLTGLSFAEWADFND